MGQTSKMAENTLTKKCTIYPYVTSPLNWTRLNITWRGVSKLITWLLINLTFFGGNASVRTRLSVSEGRHRWLNNTPLSNVNVVLITTHTIRFHKIYSNDLHSRLNVLRPRQDVSVFFFFENGDFYFRFGLPSTRIRWKRSPKTKLFKNALRSGDFRKRRLLISVWTDENGGFRIRWCHTSYITRIAHAP